MPTALDKTLSRFTGEPGELIPVLQAVQKRVGYLPKEALRRVARYCHVPESTVYGVATFYSQFYLERQGRHKIRVCRGTACHVRGSKKIMAALTRKLGIEPGETTPDYKFTLERVACFGACALAPVVVIDEKVHGGMSPQKALKAVAKLK